MKNYKRIITITLMLALAVSFMPIIPGTNWEANALTDGGNYLTFTSKENGSTVKFDYLTAASVECSWDSGSTWETYNKGEEISLLYNQVLMFRGHSVITDSSHHFTITGKVEASGSVTSLTDGSGENANVFLTGDCCMFMFSGCTGLITAPELPAKSLNTRCYCGMFNGCTSLVSAPELPATSLATECYMYMFMGCSNLKNAPELPASHLRSFCYAHMFEDCSALKDAPELSSTELEDHCYSFMFDGCTSLAKAPELPATKLRSGCYESMFTGCSALTDTPELPATVLSASCYYKMFKDCASLTSLPELPATTLADNCYENMFIGCSNIKISESKSDDYPYEWRFPALATSTGISDWNSLMISDTGGTYKGNPELNKTYYQYAATVYFDSTGGTKVDSQVVNSSCGHKLTEPTAPLKSNYVFTGWYTDSACKTAWNFDDKVAKSMILYAGWKTVNSVNEELDTLITQIKTLQDQIEALQDQIEALQKQDTLTGKEIEALQTQLTSLQTQITKIQTLITELQSKDGTAATQITALQTQLTSLLGQLKTATDKIAALEAHAIAQKAEIDKLNSTVDSLKAEIDKLNSTVDSLKAEIDKLNSKVDSLENELAIMKFEAKKMKTPTVKAANRSITLKFSAVKGADGYKIYYKDKTAKKSAAQYVTTEKTTYKITKLQKNHRYIVKVRAYKKIAGAIVYTQWSAAK